MKRYPVLLLCCLLLLYASVFGTAVFAADPITVKVGVYENQPKIFTDARGNASGFWTEIIEGIASEEGWKIEYVNGTWAEGLSRLENNEIDIMPDVAFTEERSGQFDFSNETVYVSWSRVYAKEGTDIKSILDLEGKTLAVLAGSVNFEGQEGIKELVREFDINSTFTEVDSYTRVFELVASGEVDAGVANKDFANQHLADYNLIRTAIVFQPASLHFAFPEDSSLTPYLIERIDYRMRELKQDDDSIYYQSLQKWLGVKPVEKSVIPGWMIWMLAGIGGLAFLLAAGSLVLRSQVKSRTKKLINEIAERQRTEEGLRASEERYRTTLDSMLEGCQIIGFDWRYIYLNDAAVTHSRQSREELLGRTMTEVYPGIENTEMFACLQRCMKERTPHSMENLFNYPDGSQSWFELSIEPVPEGIFILSLDITRRKRAEAHIQNLNEVLRSLRNINQLITREKDRERLIQQSCELMVETRGFYCAWIVLFDENKQHVMAAAADGEVIQGFRKQLEQGEYPPCIDRILAHDAPLAICSNIVEIQDCLPRGYHGAGEGLICRLEYEGKVYGVVSVYVPSDYAFDPEEQSLFQELAGDIAYALNSIKKEEERQRAEQRLRESEEKYRTLFENMRNGFAYCRIILDESSQPVDFVYLEVNDAFEIITGLKKEAALGRKVTEAIPGIREAHPELFDIYSRVALTGEPARFEIYFQPLKIWLDISVYSPQRGYFVAIFANITERKATEESLRIAEQNFRNSLEDSPLGIRIVTADGEVIYANKAILDIYGYGSLEELLATPIKKRYTPESYAEFRERRRLLKQGKPVPPNYEISIVRKDGEIRRLSAVRKEVLWNGEKRFQVLYQDITESKKNQERLMVTDRLASIGELASGIAHEINNPLTGIIGLSEIILDAKLPADVREDLKTINNEAQRTARIVQNLLTFARKHPLEKDLANVNDAIAKVLEMRAYEHRVNNINVITHLADDLPEINGNSFQLQQVFLNIIINAEYFMTEAHGKGTLTINTERIDDTVRISIGDDGPGIDKETLLHIFDPFFTTKEVGKGTGLGLSICHGIITEHGGRIYTESQPGKGAAFIIELPVAEAEGGEQK